MNYAKRDTGENMKLQLTPPKKIVFWIAVLLGFSSLLAKFRAIPFLSPFDYWLAFFGFALLALGLVLKGF
jgi:hypothetical protein